MAWHLDLLKGYIANDVYQLLTYGDISNNSLLSDFIRHKYVLLNVSLFVWHLLCYQISTKVNLFTCCIIQQDSQLCASECGFWVAITLTIFNICSELNWYLFGRSILFIGPLYSIWSDGGNSISLWYLLHLIWFLCAFVFWKERNNWWFNLFQSLGFLTCCIIQSLGFYVLVKLFVFYSDSSCLR